MSMGNSIEDFEILLLEKYREMASRRDYISEELYQKYDVQRGLRDKEGRGVLVGLTEIGEIQSYIVKEAETIPIPGKLIYRGVEISDIVEGFMSEGRFGYEETCYLLLFGYLPNKVELEEFEHYISKRRCLPEEFARDVIMKLPSTDIMNVLSQSVLALYGYYENPDDTSIKNVLKQCIGLIACFPLLTVYGYQVYTYYHKQNSLLLRNPKPEYRTAENILYMLRPDGIFTRFEAELLDLALVLHAEHGGGNNSAFVTHALTSTGTDTYSTIVGALSSLKGPKHGGANIKVVQMFEDIKTNIKNWEDEEEIEDYLKKVLNKEAFDGSGIIYGMGHAVYTISDPRNVIFKKQVEVLAKEKGLEAEFNLYAKVEEIAPLVITRGKNRYKAICANVDFYAGFLYRMLGIPPELFTPLFANARIVGWSAHRIEELVNGPKIIRPAYKCVAPEKKYIGLEQR